MFEISRSLASNSLKVCLVEKFMIVKGKLAAFSSVLFFNKLSNINVTISDLTCYYYFNVN